VGKKDDAVPDASGESKKQKRTVGEVLALAFTRWGRTNREDVRAGNGSLTKNRRQWASKENVATGDLGGGEIALRWDWAKTLRSAIVAGNSKSEKKRHRSTSE